MQPSNQAALMDPATPTKNSVQAVRWRWPPVWITHHLHDGTWHSYPTWLSALVHPQQSPPDLTKNRGYAWTMFHLASDRWTGKQMSNLVFMTGGTVVTHSDTNPSTHTCIHTHTCKYESPHTHIHPHTHTYKYESPHICNTTQTHMQQNTLNTTPPPPPPTHTHPMTPTHQKKNELIKERMRESERKKPEKTLGQLRQLIQGQRTLSGRSRILSIMLKPRLLIWNTFTPHLSRQCWKATIHSLSSSDQLLVETTGFIPTVPCS